MKSDWHIQFSKEALKFLEKEGLKNKVLEALRSFINGKHADIKKLTGEWKGYYRLRVGKARVILFFDFQENRIVIVKAGYRGKIYK